MGEEWEFYPGGGMGKVGPAPKGRQTICFALDMVLGLGELGGGGGSGGGGGDTPRSHSPSFVLTLTQGFIGSISSQEPLQRTPFPCLNAPALLCFSGMCFHLKTTLNGALFFPVLKIEKFLQYKQGCGGGGVGAVRGHSECILALGWDGWSQRTPPLSPLFF
uniref:Uncharacterized protein n=1 Tax=Panthera leo TaxID=9689 RepID=A0A8C8XEQ6_PANLE